jgi:hypothetical protein
LSLAGLVALEVCLLAELEGLHLVRAEINLLDLELPAETRHPDAAEGLVVE